MGLKQALRAHKLCLPTATNKKSFRGTSTASFEYGTADSSLYEGGKWGEKGLVREREEEEASESVVDE